jgi:16S rRNA (cytosine1402-N4)-methyltransferase
VRDPATVAKVLAAGKTPAGTHRPIMVGEIMAVLQPTPGEIAADCTLGFGGHAAELLRRLQPGGCLLGLDVDPLELPRTEARLRALGFGDDAFRSHHSNYAGLPRVLAREGLAGVDMILADLGVSSMQIDDPARGFSMKLNGPLDMRMNPAKGKPAREYLRAVSAEALAAALSENADEPHAAALAPSLAGQDFATTLALRDRIVALLARRPKDEQELSVRRVFQAVRIAVNEEFSALESFLRMLPNCLRPGGRVAILTFHSGEDRRVKHAFADGLRQGIYSEVAGEVTRASAAERHANPRSIPAKLRWARRSL